MTGKLMFVPDTHVVVPREIVNNLLSYVHAKECLHEDTYRGGAIWTICRSCGRKWADDDGGFEEYATPKAISNMEEALAAPPLTTPPVLRWDGCHLEMNGNIIAVLHCWSDGKWTYELWRSESFNFDTEEQARRAAEKALGLPIVEEV